MLTLPLNNNRALNEQDIHFGIQNDGQITGTSADPLSADFRQGIVSTLNGFIRNQQNDIAHADSSFLALGHDMQQLYAKTTELTDKIRRSTEIISGNGDNSVLSRLGLSITDSLAELETRQGEVSSSLQQVASVGKGMNDFHSMCPTLQNIAKFLRVIGLNICVECAQSLEASSLFMTNAEEIKDFAEEVIQINREILYDSEHTRNVLATSHKNISNSLNKIQANSSDAAKIVEESFLKIQQLMNLSLASMDQATSHSDQISKQVGEIVIGMQFHDNMSQRIEHINTALQEASSRCNAEDQNDTDIERMAEVHAITVLQAGQIREVIAGIEDVFQSNRQAFTEIGNEVSGLAEILISLTSNNDKPHTTFKPKPQKDSFSTLHSALMKLSQLLDYGNEQIGLIQEANTEASDTAARLETHIGLLRSISDNTHIKALNTIILANHLGPEGRTIEILAQEIKTIARQSNTFVVDVEQVYQTLTQTITSLQTSPDMDETIQADNSSALLHSNIQETTSAYRSFEDDSAAALRYADDLEKEISQISDSLEFLPTLATTLKENLTQLDDLSEQLSPWAGKMSKEAKEKAAIVAERYTMAEERIIHQQVFDTKEETATEDIELFGDDSDEMDIEMFGDEPDDTGIEMFDQESDSDDFELFEQPSESGDFEMFTEEPEDMVKKDTKTTAKKSVQSKNISKAEDLGENFELF